MDYDISEQDLVMTGKYITALKRFGYERDDFNVDSKGIHICYEKYIEDLWLVRFIAQFTNGAIFLTTIIQTVDKPELWAKQSQLTNEEILKIIGNEYGTISPDIPIMKVTTNCLEAHKKETIDRIKFNIDFWKTECPNDQLKKVWIEQMKNQMKTLKEMIKKGVTQYV